MLDMDHFKHINDTHGHQVGDQVLRQIGVVISTSFRETDVSGRLGGEEFAVLLPDTSIEVALNIAEQLIQTIAGLTTQSVCCISASLGVASTDAGDKDLHGLMNSADKALYRAKALGRNQVAVAEYIWCVSIVRSGVDGFIGRGRGSASKSRISLRKIFWE
jgi:diguanylate cyclase (GGDEF)-like protein